MRRVTTPIAAECSMSSPMPPTVRRMASFSSTKVVGEPLYTRDFKYPHNQKSAGVKSGDREGHLNLQFRLITRCSVKGSNRNVLTSRAKWGGEPSCMKVTASFSCNASTTWSQKSVTYRSAVTVQVIQPDTGQRFSKRMKDTVEPHETVI
ncbi:hypothetical protein AVEN_148829-1 [Araneus ventricosus]|uniref:Uncharacterized protein n=1 Tax=Araneus ventricosus TaxID=182803 RepID=A0A4Y2RJD6_ARAVE|nr:hypothetical protein AVEN_78961-1 [Araneus ventricosus]GBN75823.1 hypothetical protein AVEN_148829-1 [Araneus ventricosus]